MAQATIPIQWQTGQLPPSLNVNPQQLYELMFSITTGLMDISKFLVGRIGGTEPTTNVGPWLKNTGEWWVWDSTAMKYRPMASELEIGDMIPTAKSTCDSSRFLFCDGREISRAAPYNQLFAVIGTTWGDGNGSTTFNIPHSGSRTPIGVGLGQNPDGSVLTRRLLGEIGGQEVVSLEPDQIPLTNYTGNAPEAGVNVPKWDDYFEGSRGAVHNNMMPWFAVLWKIKYQ